MKLSFNQIKAVGRAAKSTVVKYSPEILMALGAASFVGTVIAVAKGTVKEQDVIEEHQDELEYIETCYDMNELDEKAYRKSRMDVYKNTALQTTKNYIPAVILGTSSLACFFGAFGMMKKRYTTLVIAYTAMEESFRKYRERVIADKGAEADLYYLTGSKPKEITVKDEEGNKTKKKQMILPDGTIASPYAFKFGKYKENGERNLQWSPDQMQNLAYVLGQEDYLNDQLYSRNVFDSKHRVLIRGAVMLNEIRDLLGEDPSTTGSICGNRFSNGEPGCSGHINFNVMEAMEHDPDSSDPNDMIPCLFLNPNCDGLIYDLLGKREVKPFEPTCEFNEWGEIVDV